MKTGSSNVSHSSKEIKKNIVIVSNSTNKEESYCNNSVQNSYFFCYTVHFGLSIKVPCI